ncbi:hypothetical protein RI054_21g93350 [Pseudoscourfieldia marina]
MAGMNLQWAVLELNKANSELDKERMLPTLAARCTPAEVFAFAVCDPNNTEHMLVSKLTFGTEKEKARKVFNALSHSRIAPTATPVGAPPPGAPPPQGYPQQQPPQGYPPQQQPQGYPPQPQMPVAQGYAMPLQQHPGYGAPQPGAGPAGAYPPQGYPQQQSGGYGAPPPTQYQQPGYGAPAGYPPQGVPYGGAGAQRPMGGGGGGGGNMVMAAGAGMLGGMMLGEVFK